MGSTRPNRLMWVGLDLCNGLGWVEFFLTHHGGLGQKILSTRPMHTPKKMCEREINKIIRYTSTITMHICMVTVANV